MSKTNSSSPGSDNTVHFSLNPIFWVHEQKTNNTRGRNTTSLNSSQSSPNFIGIDFRETNSTVAFSTTMYTNGGDNHEPVEVDEGEEFTLNGPSLLLRGAE